MTKTALITGASTGIGRELARIHAAAGGNAILVARSADKLEQLKSDLEKEHSVNITMIAKDLATPTAGNELAAELNAGGHEIDYLINNAGFGGHGKFHEREWAKDEAMIQLNITTLTSLTRHLLPNMVKRGSGKVLNVASVAGFVSGPLQAVYFATKAYVLSFSEAIANELKGTGVTVTALCPGATETEFAAGADLDDTNLFKGAATADAVAQYGYRAMLNGKRVAIHGLANQMLVFSTRFSPRSMVAAISRKMMEKD